MKRYFQKSRKTSLIALLILSSACTPTAFFKPLVFIQPSAQNLSLSEVSIIAVNEDGIDSLGSIGIQTWFTYLSEILDENGNEVVKHDGRVGTATVTPALYRIRFNCSGGDAFFNYSNPALIKRKLQAGNTYTFTCYPQQDGTMHIHEEVKRTQVNINK